MRGIFQEQGRGEGASDNPGPAHWSTSGLILSMTNSNTNLEPMVLVHPETLIFFNDFLCHFTAFM